MHRAPTTSAAGLVFRRDLMLALAFATAALTLAAAALAPHAYAMETIILAQAVPAVAPDGTVYVGADDKNLYALSDDGQSRWLFDTGGTITAPPVVTRDGAILVASSAQKLFAVNPDGTKKWEYNLAWAGRCALAEGDDGTIYCHTKTLIALTPKGEKCWEFFTGTASPGVLPDEFAQMLARLIDNTMPALGEDDARVIDVGEADGRGVAEHHDSLGGR